MAVAEALLSLASDFEASGAIAEALKCLAAASADGSAALPAVLACARLRLASLLLAHCDNVQEAKNVLLTAEQELRQTQGHHALKCEVWDALARCNQRLGAVAAEQAALAAGLKTCRQGASSKDKEALARWRAYFHYRLAEHGLIHEGLEAAGEALAQMEGDAGLKLAGLEGALRLLCRATLALVAGDHAAAAPALQEATQAIEEAGAADPALHRHLRCHHAVLQVSAAVVAGRINDLKQDSSHQIELLVQLQQLLAEAGGADWSYPWQPPAAVGAIGNLLHASLLRSLGRAAPAAACLAAAGEAVDQQLAAMGIDLQQGTEAQLGTAAIWRGRVFCHLKALALEQQVVSALVASRFADAAGLLGGLVGMLGRFPLLLCDSVPSVQMLLGHYAQAVGELATASSHFQAVLQSDASQLHDAAAVAAALCELQADPAGARGLRRAVELLEQRGLRGLPHVLSRPVADRTAALVTGALVAQREGDPSNASVLLTKALKTAHAHLGNTQMVAQVLNVLAPLQAAKGDRPGAEQMLNSALTLGKAQSDLPTQVTASRALLALFSGAPGEEERAGKQAAYAQRKDGELAAAVAAARGAQEHAALLAWRPAAAGAPARE